MAWAGLAGPSGSDIRSADLSGFLPPRVASLRETTTGKVRKSGRWQGRNFCWNYQGWGQLYSRIDQRSRSDSRKHAFETSKKTTFEIVLYQCNVGGMRGNSPSLLSFILPDSHSCPDTGCLDWWLELISKARTFPPHLQYNVLHQTKVPKSSHQTGKRHLLCSRLRRHCTEKYGCPTIHKSLKHSQ